MSYLNPLEQAPALTIMCLHKFVETRDRDLNPQTKYYVEKQLVKQLEKTVKKEILYEA